VLQLVAECVAAYTRVERDSERDEEREKDKARERQRKRKRKCVHMCSVCVRERERKKKERARERERDSYKSEYLLTHCLNITREKKGLSSEFVLRIISY